LLQLLGQRHTILFYQAKLTSGGGKDNVEKITIEMTEERIKSCDIEHRGRRRSCQDIGESPAIPGYQKNKR